MTSLCVGECNPISVAVIFNMDERRIKKKVSKKDKTITSRDNMKDLGENNDRNKILYYLAA